MLEGVKATFKGQIVGQELTRWPDQLDFSAELSKARAAKPDAIFAFYPGGAGIQFVTQYAQSGLKGQIPLYTGLHHRRAVAAAHEDLAVGIPGAQQWVNDLPNDANKKFVADYKAKYKARHRSTAHRPMTRSLCSKARSWRSKATSPRKTRCARRWRRPTSSPFAATSSSGANHIPIQNFYLQDVVKQGDEYVLKTVATSSRMTRTSTSDKCPMK
jgi:branched-chain amino acid transport system substrate-binding protein